MRLFFFISLCWFSLLFSKSKEEILAHIPKLEKEIVSVKDRFKAPAVGVAIVKDGEIVYSKALGVKVNGEKDLVDNETSFQIASLSKTFLVFVIAQLVDEGVLSWDTLVSKYVPEFKLNDKDACDKLTLIDLITHRVGLPSFSGDTLWHVGFGQIELLQTLSKIPLKYKFLEHYGYQNHMFSIASLLVERATKKTIEELFHERIFKPLKMKNASVGKKAVSTKLFGLIKPNFAFPHDIRDGKIYTKELNDKTYLFEGSSGINISIHDLGIWLKFVLDDYSYEGKALLKPETVHFLRTPKVKCSFSQDELQFHKDRFSNTSYDVGMFQSQYGPNKDHILYAHMGGFNGVRSYMGFMPKEKMGIIIVSNFGSMRVSLMPEVIRNTFLDWYFDFPSIDWMDKIFNTNNKWIAAHVNSRITSRMSYPVARRQYKDYVGSYHHPLYGKITISEEKNTLFMSYRDHKIELKHWNENEFNIKPYELSPTLNDYDDCPLYFSFKAGEKVKLYVGQMFELQPYFEKE